MRVLGLALAGALAPSARYRCTLSDRHRRRSSESSAEHRPGEQQWFDLAPGSRQRELACRARSFAGLEGWMLSAVLGTEPLLSRVGFLWRAGVPTYWVWGPSGGALDH